MRLHLSSHRPRASRRAIPIAAIALSFTVTVLACAQAPAAPLGFGHVGFGRALNPQPLPPGLYSPVHPGRFAARAVTLQPDHFSRRVCVAWGRVCIKAGQGTPTRPAPCGEYMYVCRKYG